MTEEKRYSIEEREGDNPARVVLSSEGDAMFSLPASFDDSQVDVVFNLCEQYFQSGRQFGIQKMQEDFHTLIGLKLVDPKELKESEE